VLPFAGRKKTATLFPRGRKYLFAELISPNEARFRGKKENQEKDVPFYTRGGKGKVTWDVPGDGGRKITLASLNAKPAAVNGLRRKGIIPKEKHDLLGGGRIDRYLLCAKRTQCLESRERSDPKRVAPPPKKFVQHWEKGEGRTAV